MGHLILGSLVQLCTIYWRPLQQGQNKGLLSPHCTRIKKALNSPFGITFKNLTNDVETTEQSKWLLDVRHYNVYLLIPRLVYYLSTKLHRQIMSQCLSKIYEIDLIHFLTRFRFAMRTSPYCKLHGTYIHYMKVKNVSYINDSQDKDQIILVTLFLTMLFNACFTYQEGNASNMLVDALDTFEWMLHYMMTHSWTLSVSAFLHTICSILEYFAWFILLTTYLLILLHRWVVFLCIRRWMCHCNINCKKTFSGYG